MNSSLRANRGPSKAPTKLARKAIADFVESNIPRFSGWLEQIAGGIPQYDRDGAIQYDTKGVPQWLVKPDPALAMKLVTDIAEYHLPKLSRSDVAVVAQVENIHRVPIEQMTTEQLNAKVLEVLGFDEGDATSITDVIDVEPVAVPEWMAARPPESS